MNNTARDNEIIRNTLTSAKTIPMVGVSFPKEEK